MNSSRLYRSIRVDGGKLAADSRPGRKWYNKTDSENREAAVPPVLYTGGVYHTPITPEATPGGRAKSDPLYLTVVYI